MRYQPWTWDSGEDDDDDDDDGYYTNVQWVQLQYPHDGRGMARANLRDHRMAESGRSDLKFQCCVSFAVRLALSVALRSFQCAVFY